MSRDMLDYIDENTRISAEKQRINTELDMAASIQASHCPACFRRSRTGASSTYSPR